MGYHRGRPKLHLHLATGGILTLACGVAAYRFTNRNNDVWEAAKVAATKQIQEEAGSSVQPFYPDHGEIKFEEGAFIVQSWVDINGQRVQWEAAVTKKDGRCEVVGVLIDPEAIQRRLQASLYQ